MSIWRKEPDSDWLAKIEIAKSGKWYGPYNEDSVIDSVFMNVIDEHKFALDLGAGTGLNGSNVRFLADKYGWKTVELDGKVKRHKSHPSVCEEWITPDNLTFLLDKYDVPKNMDLLSLDLDSMDFYILESFLKAGYRSSLVILEFNPLFECDQSYTIKYDANYRKDRTSRYGASLLAFNRLMSSYAYELFYVPPHSDDIESNNAYFIDSKYVEEDTVIRSICDLHPKSWAESWKTKNPQVGTGKLRKRYKTNFIEVHNDGSY